MTENFDVICLGGGVGGAKIFRGDGRLTDVGTVDVGGTRLVAGRAVVIANGSTTRIPPVRGLESIDFWTNRQAAVPSERPSSMAILGGGAIAVELGQAFARFGSAVTIIEAGSTFLGLEEPEAGAALRPHLEADGIRLTIGDPCVAIEQGPIGGSGRRTVVLRLHSGAQLQADRLLVATGRRANAESWLGSGLQQTSGGWLKVDPETLEARPGIFGAGDVTGLGGFTHLAHYHGQVIARRIRGENARADHTAVPRVTYTDPKMASVGISEAAARALGIDVAVALIDPADTARGLIHDFHGGALKPVADRARGVLVGATLVSPRAGEIVGELVLAIKLRAPLSILADVIHPLPAFNRVLGAAIEQLAARSAPPTARSAAPTWPNPKRSPSTDGGLHEHTPKLLSQPPERFITRNRSQARGHRSSGGQRRSRQGLLQRPPVRLDADSANGDGWRLVQMTPPGSPCSVMFGKGFTSAAPGSVQGSFLVVDDIDSARTELAALGVQVSEPFHFEGDLLNVRGQRQSAGHDPKGRSYFSFATFNDPDGNGWLLQEVTSRFPGRGFSSDVPTLTDLLREADERHGRYDVTAAKHPWSDWYAPYKV